MFLFDKIFSHHGVVFQNETFEWVIQMFWTCSLLWSQLNIQLWLFSWRVSCYRLSIIFFSKKFVTFWWVTWGGGGSSEKMTKCDMGGGGVKNGHFRSDILFAWPLTWLLYEQNLLCVILMECCMIILRCACSVRGAANRMWFNYLLIVLITSLTNTHLNCG